MRRGYPAHGNWRYLRQTWCFADERRHSGGGKDPRPQSDGYPSDGFSAHKMYYLKGVGALYVCRRSPA